MNSDFYTKAEIAEMLGVHPLTIHRMAKSEKIPAPIRFGHRTVRWNKKKFDEWLENK